MKQYRKQKPMAQSTNICILKRLSDWSSSPRITQQATWRCTRALWWNEHVCTFGFRRALGNWPKGLAKALQPIWAGQALIVAWPFTNVVCCGHWLHEKIVHIRVGEHLLGATVTQVAPWRCPRALWWNGHGCTAFVQPSPRQLDQRTRQGPNTFLSRTGSGRNMSY